MERCLVFTICILLSIVNWIKCDSEESTTASPRYCMNLTPQTGLNIEQMLGMWYGNEIITHNGASVPGVFYYNSCVRIHLSNYTEMLYITTTEANYYSAYARPERNRSDQFLRLIWDENGTNLEYTLRYNSSNRGFWISSGPQKGNMADMVQYRPFSGTVQVMKAVADHIVLTFCNSIPGTQLFSVVLSRKPESLTSEDLESVRKLLEWRGLLTSERRKVCSSGAVNVAVSGLFVFLLTLIISKYL